VNQTLECSKDKETKLEREEKYFIRMWMKEIEDILAARHLKKGAEAVPEQDPGDQPKKVRILRDEDVRKEAARVYQDYRVVMRKLRQ
jgi:predicted restriction endonuclease